MKNFFTLIILAFSILTVKSETITKTYQVSDLQISSKAGFQTLTFKDMLFAGKTGEPALPYQAIKLMLPPGHEAVSITLQGSDKISLDGSYRLYPMQHSRPLSEGSERSFILNSELYNSTAKYPQSQTGILSTHFMNGYSYALCTFTPVEYYPASGNISYFSTVTITIETQPTDRAAAALSNLSSNTETTRRCMAFADNPQQSAAYSNPVRSTDNYDILIITPETFISQIQILADNYTDQGLISKIVSTGYIESHGTGNDMPEKIRNLIIGEYQSYGISQVILGGDVELVAFRGFYCAAQSSILYEDASIPADLYYSGLDGNWNTNNNQLWAEIGEDDLLPDISVGRMSFSNIFELSAMLNKTMSYQNHPVTGELNKHLLAGENLWYGPDTWGSDYLELLIGYHADNGYITTGIPETYPIDKLYDEVTFWTAGDLISAINQGHSMINHVGHANDSYVAKLYIPDITNSNFYGANGTSHNFPVFYTHGCICGAFDYNDCIAEKMVSINNFASAFVGNSRYGWFNEGQTEGPSPHLNREFIDALYSDSLNRIGSAHLESKIATSPWVNAPGQWEEGALRWCFYDCNVLGDPAMAVWTNEPITVNPVYPSQIPVGTTSFEVTVLNQGAPAEGMTVALIKDNVLIGRGKTNHAGVALVVMDTVITTAGTAEIMISGYNCNPTSFLTGFTVGINDIPLSNIRIYPNPAVDNFRISIPPDSKTTQFTLKDASGKIIKEIRISAGVQEYTVETMGIQPGTYFLSASGPSESALKIIIK